MSLFCFTPLYYSLPASTTLDSRCSCCHYYFYYHYNYHYYNYHYYYYDYYDYDYNYYSYCCCCCCYYYYCYYYLLLLLNRFIFCFSFSFSFSFSPVLVSSGGSFLPFLLLLDPDTIKCVPPCESVTNNQKGGGLGLEDLKFQKSLDCHPACLPACT